MNNIITSLLDTDFYKFTMGQFAWLYYPDVKVKYAFTDRTKDSTLLDFGVTDEGIVRNIIEELDAVRNLKFTLEELNYLSNLGIFSKEYLNFLSNLNLPPVYVSIKKNKLIIETEGKWSEAIFWETFILSIVNELYHRRFLNVGHIGECDRRLDTKIDKINATPFKFIEFGTRRRFSKEIQDRVLRELLAGIHNDSLLGTSNVYLAKEYDLKPIGTMAHELPMVIAGLNEAFVGVSDYSRHIIFKHCAFNNWYELCGEDLSIALTDTFGSDFFFEDFSKNQAKKWRGLRQDSGDPIGFGYKAIEFYNKHGINPKEKLIVFSDGLNINKIYKIEKEFKGKIQTAYGWGTNLTNDVGYDKNCSYIGKPLSIVVKAVEANGIPLVKLTDNLNKAVGDKKTIERYKKAFGYKNTYKEQLKY